MKADTIVKARSERVWISLDQCKLDQFVTLVERKTNLADYPLASSVDANVPIYAGDSVRAAGKDPLARKAIMAEWAEVMLSGPGIIVVKSAFDDIRPIDAASKIFFAIIEEQHQNKTSSGDHFAKPGANDRVWNALEKLCMRAPEVFVQYYANEVIAMASEAWLGTGYQITSALNVVNPGGEAQSAHRDYHMGFQTAEQIEHFPVHAHQLSPVLTLQGAIAHCDMPIETGPTLYLPYSQVFVPGYFAWQKQEFMDYFNEKRVQLPLSKGDAAFFNPAVFHAAGHNRTKNVKRMANLLQVSSAYGRAMESVDRTRMSLLLYPVLVSMRSLDKALLNNVIAASAEGYAFPTNLDRDPPLGGLAPRTQQQIMAQALAEDWAFDKFKAVLEERSFSRAA